MVSQRNRVIRLSEYIKNCGVEVNIARNKARGNHGFFKVQGNKFRIDISKEISEDETVTVLIHEFAHFVHYNYDKKLKDLSFIFKDLTDTIQEELINITVSSISKKEIKPFFEKKSLLKKDIQDLTNLILESCDKKKLTECVGILEKDIKSKGLNFLLKYDRVKLLKGFTPKLYTISNLDNNSEGLLNTSVLYLKLNSKQRELKRLNSKISRINKYYNSPTELFARAFTIYLTDREQMRKIAPNTAAFVENAIQQEDIPLLSNLVKIF